MTKIFAASFTCEVNTFSEFPADESAFYTGYYTAHGEHDVNHPHFIALPLVVAKQEADKRGWLYQESICAAAAPAGPLTTACYDKFKAEIIADLKKARDSIDGIFLFLHGAMVAENCDDCEGDLLAAIRTIIGDDIPIAVLLDPHAHLSQKMLDHADIITLLKEYPHTDYQICAKENFEILAETILGNYQPVTSIADCHMISLYPTSLEPMKSFVSEIRQLEANNDNILNISVVHGFPWGDVPGMGTKIIVTTHADKQAGDQLAFDLAEKLKHIKPQTLPTFYSLDDALARFKEHDKMTPLIFADFSDNTGMGAMGDSTFILERLIAKHLDHIALSPLYDPGNVKQCFKQQDNTEIVLNIGGKGRYSGKSLLVSATIIKRQEDFRTQFAGGEADYGDCVTIKLHGFKHFYIVLSSKRMQTFSPECFTKMGINLRDLQLLVVKSAEHYRSAFTTVTKVENMLTISSPGLVNLDFASIAYRKAKLFK